MSLTRKLASKKELNGVLLSFLLGALGALAIFLPFLIIDKGFFIYCGDFNEQQIPFYLHVHDFIRTGGGTWSWATDIGSSIINSYSFYNLGSPFLWLTLPFPSSMVPYMMVPLFCLKFGGIAAAACLYIKRYAKTRNMAVICSLVYAFCGFNIYNIFFNHMLEPVIIFPLMLWALDGFIHDKQRGLFAVFIGLSLLNSYFFFIGNAVFIIIYFFVKVALGDFKITLKNFSFLTIEVLIGVGIGMIIVLPSFLVLIQNPRISDFSNGLGLLLYGDVHQYANIFLTMLVPPDPPYMPNLLQNGAIKWTSMSSFLPIISIAGVVAFCKSRKKSWVKYILGICLLMALVPILNSSFYAFNSSYYARWFYMPILIMCLASMHSLEDEDINLMGGVKFTFVITCLYAIFGLLPTLKDGDWKLGAAEYASKFWLTAVTAILGIAIFYFLVKFYKKKPRFAPILLSVVMGFSVFYSVIHISLGKFPQFESDAVYKDENYVSARALGEKLPNDEFYRIDSYEVTDNIGLWMNKSSIRCFNSVVNPSIMEFNPLVGVKRDVSSKPDRNLISHRGLLSVKYTVMPTDEIEGFESAMGENEFNGNLGWKPFMTQGSLSVYENENFIPLGFTYDNYIWLEHLELAQESHRSALLLRGIGLDFEQVENYGYLLSEGEAGTRIEQGEEVKFEYDEVNYDAYVEQAAKRKASSSYETSYDASGFTSKIKMDKETFVFFGVPYDEGFTATVNGQAAQVHKVSGGMMAVIAPSGDNEIVFTYKTPGFDKGIIITLASIFALIAYLFICKLLKNKKTSTREKEFAQKMASAKLNKQDAKKAEFEKTKELMNHEKLPKKGEEFENEKEADNAEFDTEILEEESMIIAENIEKNSAKTGEETEDVDNDLKQKKPDEIAEINAEDTQEFAPLQQPEILKNEAGSLQQASGVSVPDTAAPHRVNKSNEREIDKIIEEFGLPKEL